MTANKTVILIIGGAWHKPHHYAKLRLALESAGHEVHCPELPSTDEARPPNGSMMRDIACIKEIAEKLVNAGRRVVAIGHSYGGQLITHGLHGLGIEARRSEGEKGGIAHLIYMCAYVLSEGGSIWGKIEEMGQAHLMDIVFKYGDDRTVLCSDPRRQLIGEDGDEEEVQRYLDSLALWNGWCAQDCIGKCAWRDIPMTYIKTLNDVAVPLSYQESMLQVVEKEKGRKVPTHALATGHCPNLTAAEEIANIINGVVAAI